MESTAEHDGCRIAYAVRGSGPPVLWIQGVGVHGDGWRPQVDALAPRWTCLSFDHRGIGRSVPRGAGVTVERMATDALAVLDAAGVSNAHVVGHSLGGLVAVELALSARERVRSLALLCTFARGRAVAPLTARMAWLGLRTRVGTRRMRRRAFLRLVMPPGEIPDEDAAAARLAELFGHDLAVLPPAAGDQLRALRRADTTRRLNTLADLPTLVVSAAHDPIAPPSAGAELSEGIPGARFVVIGDASHALPITHADRVNALLGDHLVEVESRPVGR